MSCNSISSDTCYTAAAHETCSQKSDAVSSCEDVSKKEKSVDEPRSIPIKIETSDNSEKNSSVETKLQETTNDRLIQIEICVEKESPEDSPKQINVSEEPLKMPSIRTIPIQRITSNSSNDSQSLSPPVPLSPSKEVVNQPSKIKMGTSAIRIPIQIQKSEEALYSDKKVKDPLIKEGLVAMKPPQSTRAVPILRQSLSDSGVSNSSQSGERSRNLSTSSYQDDRLQKVHEELEVCC